MHDDWKCKAKEFSESKRGFISKHQASIFQKTGKMSSPYRLIRSWQKAAVLHYKNFLNSDIIILNTMNSEFYEIMTW